MFWGCTPDCRCNCLTEARYTFIELEDILFIASDVTNLQSVTSVVGVGGTEITRQNSRYLLIPVEDVHRVGAASPLEKNSTAWSSDEMSSLGGR